MQKNPGLSLVTAGCGGVILGGAIGAGVTFLGGVLGSALENALGIMLNWELTIITIGVFNLSGGMLSGLLGVLSRRPLRGLLIGVALHGIVFSGCILTSDSLHAAPTSVNAWFLAQGITAGGLAGLLGGLLGWRKP